MLYYSFRVSLMLAAILGVFHMIDEKQYTYLFFLLAIILWAVYSFFDANDREYLKRNGIDPDYFDWITPNCNRYSGVYDNTYTRNSTTYNRRTEADYSRYASKTQYGEYNYYAQNAYKGLKDKCKRNFKITISKD